jgi:signal transduction histidine kinase
MNTDMRLADFILSEMEAILVSWEAFAATQLPAAAHMQPLALRDHAQQILEAVSTDLRTLQGRDAQTEKSLGRAPVLSAAPATAAQTHAVLRANSGFDINQLAAEYRALRASVLRLWTDAFPRVEVTRLDDVIRFNEAIDQALGESIAFFSRRVERSRNLFLGMLGHDMRSPLQTIVMTSSYLSALDAGAEVSKAASRLINSGAQMQALLDDLLDFNRTQLGLGINIIPKPVDLARLFVDELDRIRAAHPGCDVKLQVSGDCFGEWDPLRLQQLLANLTLNAIRYGTAGTTVHVMLRGDEAHVEFDVRNAGPAIDRESLASIFDPLTRGLGQEQPDRNNGSLGLGLYIAREIAKGHGGDIRARSDPGQTIFSVRLPRRR